MTKRPRLGDAGKNLFAKTERTGADVLDVVTGSQTKEAKPEKPARVQADDPRSFTVTNLRLRPEHVLALQLEAVERRAQRGFGRADANEVVREILDGWLESRG